MRNRQSKSLVLYLFTTYLNRSGAYCLSLLRAVVKHGQTTKANHSESLQSDAVAAATKPYS